MDIRCPRHGTRARLFYFPLILPPTTLDSLSLLMRRPSQRCAITEMGAFHIAIGDVATI
ncbi:hypothetical protein K443DRAFT_10094 [Laccaria amethystina LaAM-08-1]|uniref:Uncharacterized protein n=1 Tax=Laccaria amethystina LaAM-08-1 TaxID=1095629 RepID=A0A0C9XHN7_9AGAR|nr:hypothetical protein K443DRAFT_10094 [Laccaria amethystina LaAM-08-1]